MRTAVNPQKSHRLPTCSAQKLTSGKPYRILISSLCECTGQYSSHLLLSLRVCLEVTRAGVLGYLLPTWCRYYEEKGFSVILAARTLNVLALGFTVVFSGFLLLSVKWSALHSECVVAGTCDIAEVCICRQCRMHHFTDMPVCQSCKGMYAGWHWTST